MARSMSELIELQNTGSLDKAVIEEVRKEGLPEFLSSAWKGIAASESPAQYRETLSQFSRCCAHIFGADAPICTQIRHQMESNNFDKKAQDLLDSNLLTGNHPAGIVPVMYEDANNLEHFIGLLNDIAVNGVKDTIILNEDGLILDGQQRFRASILTGRLSFPTKVRKDWTMADTWATLSRRHLTKSQKIALAYHTGIRNVYTKQAEAADYIGVARSSVAVFDAARKTIADLGLPSQPLLMNVITGVWDITKYNKAAKAAQEAEYIRYGLQAAGVTDLKRKDPASMAGELLLDSNNYFSNLDSVIGNLTDEQVEKLQETKFPTKLLPAQDQEEDVTMSSPVAELDEVHGVLLQADGANVLIYSDVAEHAEAAAEGLLNVLPDYTTVVQLTDMLLALHYSNEEEEQEITL